MNGIQLRNKRTATVARLCGPEAQSEAQPRASEADRTRWVRHRHLLYFPRRWTVRRLPELALKGGAQFIAGPFTPVAGQAQGGRKQKKWDARLFVRNAETLAANKGSIRDRASYNDPLSYPPDVRHPPFLTLQGSLLPNHQKRNQDGDKRPYKKKLAHKTLILQPG